MRLKSFRTALISILSLSFLSCSGSPPKLERPIEMYGGIPERQEMCLVTPDTLTAFVQRIAKHQRTRAYAPAVIQQVLVTGLKCIKASDPKFAAMVGIPADDLRVLLQYNENLIYKCAKWKQ